jgi:antirestriction protein ArdC
MSKGACINGKGEKVVGFDEMVERLLTAMESGTNPWQQPWLTERPRNATTGVEYHGVNAMWLHFVCASRGWTDRRFLTDKQLQEKGGEPLPKCGRKFPIAFWKPLEKPARKLANGSYSKSARQNAAGEWVEDVWIIREYYVWHISQVKVDAAKLAKSEVSRRDVGTVELAEELLSADSLPETQHEGDSAFYSPAGDYIRIPARDTFKTAAGYYSVRFHEAAHATGHPSRLNRFKRDETLSGHQNYSLEELTAEMTAPSLVAYCGMEAEVTNSAAYLKGWATSLRANPKHLMTAASRAQKAYEWIVNKGKGESPTAAEEAA